MVKCKEEIDGHEVDKEERERERGGDMEVEALIDQHVTSDESLTLCSLFLYT